METRKNIEEIIGRTFVKSSVGPNKDTQKYRTHRNEDILFWMEDITGAVIVFYHIQDCCESVWLEDIVGDIRDLIGVPIRKAEIVTEDDSDYDEGDCNQWTFYHITTFNGTVTLRFNGASNCYYSIEVDYEMIYPNDY